MVPDGPETELEPETPELELDEPELLVSGLMTISRASLFPLTTGPPTKTDWPSASV